MPEFRVGRPDLPWLAERVICSGTKVTGRRALSVQTAPLGVVRTMASAEVTHPGLGETERTRPDAQFYGSSEAQPEELVALGAQGDQRGRRIAYARRGPRWNPQSGMVEARDERARADRRGRHADRPAAQRIVARMGRQGLPTGVPLRTLGSALDARCGTATALRADRRGGPVAMVPPQQLPSVQGSPVECVIVTSDALAPTFSSSRTGRRSPAFRPSMRTTSFIRAQYPERGRRPPERIRLFLRDAYFAGA